MQQVCLNDNLISVLLAGWAVLPALLLAKFNFDNLSDLKDPYCILLLSVMPVDAVQKKEDEIRLIGSWDLEVLFQKVLPTGHNADRVIINYRMSKVRLITFHLKFNAAAMSQRAHRCNNRLYNWIALQVGSKSFQQVVLYISLQTLIPVVRHVVQFLMLKKKVLFA